MVDIVIPLRVVRLNSAGFHSLKVMGLVVVVFQNQVNMPIGLYETSHCIGKFRQDMRSRVVDDRVNRVQPESVELILRQPIHSVLDEEVADGSTLMPIEVDGVAPGSLVPDRKSTRLNSSHLGISYAV